MGTSLSSDFAALVPASAIRPLDSSPSSQDRERPEKQAAKRRPPLDTNTVPDDDNADPVPGDPAHQLDRLA